MKNTNVHIILNTHHVVNMIRQFGYTFWTLTADYSYHTGKPYHTVQVMIFFSRGGGGQSHKIRLPSKSPIPIPTTKGNCIRKQTH